MQPGEQRQIQVKIKNTGTIQLRRIRYGGNLLVDPVVSSQVDWDEYQFPHQTGSLSKNLLPGEEETIRFTIKAPVTGKYALRVRFIDGEDGGPTTKRFVGDPSNEAVITVGNPDAVSLTCPAGYKVIDARTQLTFRGHSGHHWLSEFAPAAGEIRRYCLVVDEAIINGNLGIYSTDGSDDAPSSYWRMDVVPPAGSGLQLRPGARDETARVQYQTYINSTFNQPVVGNYLVTITGIAQHSRNLYLASLANTEGYTRELPYRA